jgi:O-antigen/teichoic acid export membrane protein
LIRLFYSSRFIDAAAPMAILVWGVGFLTIFYVLSFVMNGAGRVKTSMWLAISGFTVNAVLNYFFIKSNGIIGSAVATSISSILITFIMLYFIWKYFAVKIELKSLARITLAGAIMYAASLFFSKGEFIFIIWSVILFILYLLVLYLLCEIDNKDLASLRGMLARKKDTSGN